MPKTGVSRLISVALALLVGFGSAGMVVAEEKKAKKSASAKVIAKVNGEEITKAEFDQVMKGNRRFFDLTRDSVRTKLKGKRLDEYLFDREIVRIKSFAQSKADALPTMREKIEQAQERLAAGEDFAKVASEMSEDQVSAARGGDLGEMSFFELVHPFNRVALSLKEGQTSDPVLTVFGYHLIKVDKIYPPMEGKPKRVHVRHILINFPGDPRSEADQAMTAAEVEILDKKYCKKLPGYCEGKG